MLTLLAGNVPFTKKGKIDGREGAQERIPLHADWLCGSSSGDRCDATRHAAILCRYRRKFGLPIAIPFGIPTYWSPEAALAIFDLKGLVSGERCSLTVETGC
jgi:hypothetical protein